ncbi:MAG TPA: DUF5305 family protein, partial [Acidimicrobiia bacterium]
WHPTSGEILGEAWFKVPRLGNLVAKARTPLGLGALGGTTTFLMLIGGGSAHEVRHRDSRRRRRRRQGGRANTAPASRRLKVGAGALATVAFAVLTFQAFRLPSSRTVQGGEPQYVQTAEFSYTVHVEPSTVYESDTIGPVSSHDETGDIPPLYGRLVRGVDLDYRYVLSSTDAVETQGELSADLLIQAGEDGWTRTLSLADAEPFTGVSTGASWSVDIDRILALIATAEEETGYRPSTYLVTVAPAVTITGTVGEVTVDHTYSETFTMELTNGRVFPPAELVFNVATTIEAEAEVPNTASIVGIEIGVFQLRLIGLAGLVLAVLATGMLTAVEFLGLGRSPTAQIEARYRSVLVPANQIELGDHAQQIEVESFVDLARLARNEHQMIFYHENGSGRTYFVPDGDTVYQYTGTATHRKETRS